MKLNQALIGVLCFFLAIALGTTTAVATTGDGEVLGATKIVDNGPASDRFNLVIIGEGYQNDEQNLFEAHVQTFVNFLFATPPFSTSSSALNVWRINVASDQSGADDPTGCGGTGAEVDTYFDASFCIGGIRRLLVGNTATAINALDAHVPEWDHALIIVNSTVYGGSGGNVAFTSVGGSWRDVAVHELGHAAFGLADEYEYWAGCGIDTDRDNHPAVEPAEPNVTIETDLDFVKWGDLILVTTPVPTTQNADCTQCDTQGNPYLGQTVVGLYEGAHYYHCDVFRPAFNCMMRNFEPFCPVCTRRILEVLEPFIAPSNPISYGLNWLRKQQKANGSWYDNPGVTALSTLAFLNAGYTEEDEVVKDAIDYIAGFVQLNGSFDSGWGYSNYETSICILPLVATHNSVYHDMIRNAKNYLLSIQNTETNGYSPSDEAYGGWGYPRNNWADLSNTQWTLMGLHFAYEELGLSQEGETWVDKALTWVRHCQNNDSINDLPFAQGRTDGGLTYNPSGVGPQWTNESYASMTYAGIWSYALLGLDKNSDEIEAALGWVENNYNIDSNPPFGDFALYYNFITMAKALSMIDVSEINGHPWKDELTEQLEDLQHEDGYWVNSNTMEWEGVPELSTAYAILALQAFQEISGDLWMEVILASPADLVVYDPQGRSCSKDMCNIPGATFEVDATGRQIVTLLELESGHYCLVFHGTGDGIIHLTVNGRRGSEIISTVLKEFEIKVNEVWESDVLISSLVGALTIDIEEPEIVTVPGDLDHDSDCDGNDRAILRASLGKCDGDAGYNAECDYDSDGCISYADYRVWYGYYRDYMTSQ